MRRVILVILAVLAMPAMFHLAKMEVSHAHAEMGRAHQAGAPAMPECPVGYVCPVKAERFSAGGSFVAAPVLPFSLLALLAAIPLALALVPRFRYRPPLAVAIPTDPKTALSVFKRE